MNVSSTNPPAHPITRLAIGPIIPEHEPSVINLWRACDLVAPYNVPGADFRFTRAGPCSDVLVGEEWPHKRQRRSRS